MKKKAILVVLALFGAWSLNAQLIKPNFGIKSHPTLVVEKIERILKMTIVDLSIRCEVEQGGWFCADKNIVLQDPLSKKEYQMVKSENIPVCPQQHQFKRKGEMLRFKLYFAEIPSSVKYLDLIEKCSDACFYVKGIVLSSGFNAEIEMAYLLYSKGKLADAAEAFQQMVNLHADYPYGLFHFQTIKTLYELKDKPKLAVSLARFKQTNLLDKSFYQDLIEKSKYNQ